MNHDFQMAQIYGLKRQITSMRRLDNSQSIHKDIQVY
jgi:hypothetical protein